MRRGLRESINDFAPLGNGQSTENKVVADLTREYNEQPLVGNSKNVWKATVEARMEIDWAYLRKG
ncbi:MAG: hypothetical protein FWF31_09955 [Desulfobulbus sp.]|nr:hypothetical protein [Desulfobulbus sp.]